jgi:S-adenosylmethionine:tRNA ribosyltransferase-isomerase
LDDGLRTADFDFDLPEGLIAQSPALRRDGSRLMVLSRQSGALLHRHFYDLPVFLRAGDCLVLNDTKVLPARLLGARQPGGGAAEALLLQDLGGDCWECLVFPGKRLRVGARVDFGGGALRAEVTAVLENGNRVLHFDYDGVFLEVLARVGTLPLPHYIKAQPADPGRYQTVYARENGSAAAPTAGLHFTPEMLETLAGMGVAIAKLTLHVGIGTFRPVKAERIRDHVMHSERYHIEAPAAEAINRARANGGRVIAVGTTSCRTLESVADDRGFVQPCAGATDIFISPGYRFKAIDGLITNFHLPKSTLIMLVSALAGREAVLSAYRAAVAEQYRFYSFGDAMLVI